MITKLGKEHLESIIYLERNSWIPFAQADKETILKRFGLGHIMIGVLEDDELTGMISFSYSNFSPDDYEKFPKGFGEFSSQEPSENYNSAFIYNLSILPKERGRYYAQMLIREALETARNKGCEYAVADGRCPSYNGSSGFEQENVKQRIEFKEAIDRYLGGGPFPEKEELLKDPTLAFYHRFGEFLWIMPDFLPEDKPSGGIRVIIYKKLSED